MVGSSNLKIVRHALGPLLLVTAGIGAAFAQNTVIDKGLLSSVGLVAAITGQIGNTPVFGAGIVFAREKNRLYIATANHVVRQGGTEAGSLQVKLRNWPDKLLKATLLPQSDGQLDVAAVTVEGLVANGVDPCALSLDRMAPPEAVKRGVEVFPIGNPNGVPWTVPVRADDILDVRDNQVIFESTRIARGHSGGALLGTSGLLMGMIQADEPPNGRALGMGTLMRVLEGWKLPVHVRVPAKNAFGDDSTLLLAAVRKDDVEDARRLVGQVCTNVNSTADGFPVLRAAKGAAMVNLLVEAGAEVNPRSTSRISALEDAAGRGNIEVARALIAHGAEVNRNNSGGSGSALATAAADGQLEMVKFLLANGANPNLTGYQNRQTAVMHAVFANGHKPVHDEILRVLIQAGADVNWKADKNYEEDTPLTRAVKQGEVGAIKILLEAGADTSIKDGRGDSPLHLIAVRNLYDGGHFQEIAMSVLQFSREIEAEDGHALLARAVGEEWPEMASLIIRRGFKVKGEAGNEFLKDAAQLIHPEVMRVLLEAGADPDAGGQPWTPLETALHNEEPVARFEMVQLLVSRGAKVNLGRLEPEDDQQPISRAVIDLKDLKLAEFLVANGAVITPRMIELARERHQTDAVALFLKVRQAALPAKK
jgi:ankyrin repeat protein